MSKQPKRVENELSDEDMKIWTEYLSTGKVKDEEHQKQLARLAKRQVNLADVAQIVDFMSRRNDGYISHIIEQNAILDRLVTRLGATEEMRKEAKAEYDEEMEDLKEQIEEYSKKLKEEKEEKEEKEKKDKAEDSNSIPSEENEKKMTKEDAEKQKDKSLEVEKADVVSMEEVKENKDDK